MRNRNGGVWVLAVLLFGIFHGPESGASGMSLKAVELLALQKDPSVRIVEANRLALDEMSVAAKQLPDPLLKLGMVSLPTDSFRLGQEPMTQVQVGVVQKFPRGQTRSLAARQFEERAKGLGELVLDQKLVTTLSVREQYLEVVKQQYLATVNDEAVGVFSELADIIQDYYATGRVRQEDVLQSVVELAKVEERAKQIAQKEEQARSRLAVWIGNAAFEVFDDSWPRMPAPSPSSVIESTLDQHPRVRALSRNIAAAEANVDLARQKYKPEFSLDLTYGGRAGTNPDGSSRSDLLSLMVVMDLPLFTGNRQDRITAARIAESSAVEFTRDDIFRRMLSEVELHSVTWQRQRERIELFEKTLLPQAAFSSESSFDSYQSFFGDLTTLLRARITEFELRLDHGRLLAESLKTQARLLYLDGEFK
jgi:outer membrane protein TolC